MIFPPKNYPKNQIFWDSAEISDHMCLLDAHHKKSLLETTREVYIFRILNYYLCEYFTKQGIYLKTKIKQI